MIKITVDDSEIKNLIRRIAVKQSDLTPVTREIAAKLLDIVEENFASGGRPPWKPSKRAEKEGGKTLIVSAILKNSISPKHDAKSAEVGTNIQYAAIHQFGGKAGRGKKVTIPARPFLNLPEEEKDDLRDILRNFLDRL